MVAALVKLRLLILRNSLRRSTAQVIFLIIGALYGFGILVSVIAGLFLLSVAPVDIIRTVTVVVGSATVLGWIVIPLAFSGIDQTLEPQRLAPFPIPLRSLLIGLTICGVVGIPGAVTTIAAVLTAGSWLRHPVIILPAALCGAIGALTAIIGSRTVTAVSSGFSSGRRFRELSGLAILIPLTLLGPIAFAVSQGVAHSASAFPSFADALSWTPLGAIWAVPSALVTGDVLGAIARLGIALAFVVALFLLWRVALARALVTPRHSAARTRSRRRLGWFGRLPATPAGAIMARSLTYWFRDPRYLRQLITVPLFPVLLLFYSIIGHSTLFLLAWGPAVAFGLALATLSDVSFDGTAFALHLTTGVRGRDDRVGRAAALAAFGVPVVIIFVFASAAISHSWVHLPALLGVSIGWLLTGLGVSAVSSSLITVPVPAPGDNVFRTRQGTNLVNAGVGFAVLGIVIGFSLPEIAMLVVSLVTGSMLWGWIGLIIGVGLGSVLLWLGTRMGGRIFDRRAVDLFASLQKAR